MLIGIVPGRSLRWAPQWGCSEHTVVFDASSGDYWVLAPEGRATVEWLQAEREIEREHLLTRLAALTRNGDALLDGLVRAGLVTGLVDGLAVRLEPPAEPGD